jgi:fructoselysine/glucoselysine PTS system EIIB component
MIKILRVDHRLLHGQVAFSWTNAIGADCILIANDDVVNDEIHKTTLKLAKPHGVKLVIKNIQDSIDSILSGVTDKYKLFIVVSTIEDAYKLTTAVEEITSINLGGIKAKEGTRTLSPAIHVFPHEEELLKKLIESNVEVEIRQVPTDKKLNAQSVLM